MGTQNDIQTNDEVKAATGSSGDESAQGQDASAASAKPTDAEKQEAPVADAEGQTDDQRIAELEAKLAELNDAYLRKAADFENFRKRVNREKQELSDYANQNLLLDIVPALDDFERAIKSAESTRDFASFHEGIVLIEKQLFSQLESKWALKRFDSEGQPFDPNRHEAIQMEKTAEISDPVVKEDYVKGYTLKDKVIRYAKVKVLLPLDTPASAEGAAQALDPAAQA